MKIRLATAEIYIIGGVKLSQGETFLNSAKVCLSLREGFKKKKLTEFSVKVGGWGQHPGIEKIFFGWQPRIFG